jgi:hypothetical protein
MADCHSVDRVHAPLSASGNISLRLSIRFIMRPSFLIRNRPSHRRALAAANGRHLGAERANTIAQAVAVALCLAVIATIALRGC